MAEIEPPNKKAKTLQGMDKVIESVINSKTNLRAVVDDVYTKPLVLTKCYAGCVKNVKQLSRIILLLNEKLPLKSFQHLKRVYRHLVLICPVSHFQNTVNESIQSYLDSNIPELENVFDYIKEVDVPATAPLTEKQYHETRFRWSCNFHLIAQIEGLLSGHYFSENDLLLHKTYMGIGLEIAKIYMRKNCDGKEDLKCCKANAAVVVDPTIGSVVAIALDNRIEHPTQHATMVAIDNVAKTQNGGAWDDNKLTNDVTLKIQQKYPNIPFGARKFFSKKEETDDNKADSSPYLCTGYDIYLVREPCIMCAMGLVHARIKRVFYAFENVTLGALNTKIKLHCVPYLNHRFEVFTGFETSTEVLEFPKDGNTEQTLTEKKEPLNS